MFNEAIQSYRQAVRDIHRHGLVALAEVVRDKYPNATHILLESSDQGDWLTFVGVIDPTADEDEHFVEDDDLAEAVDDFAGSFYDNDAWGNLWSIFEVDGIGREYGHSGVLDIDLILFCHGDYDRALEARDA